MWLWHIKSCSSLNCEIILPDDKQICLPAVVDPPVAGLDKQMTLQPKRCSQMNKRRLHPRFAVVGRNFQQKSLVSEGSLDSYQPVIFLSNKHRPTEIPTIIRLRIYPELGAVQLIHTQLNGFCNSQPLTITRLPEHLVGNGVGVKVVELVCCWPGSGFVHKVDESTVICRERNALGIDFGILSTDLIKELSVLQCYIVQGISKNLLRIA